MVTVYALLFVGLLVVAFSLVKMWLKERKDQEYDTWFNSGSGERRKRFKGDDE